MRLFFIAAILLTGAFTLAQTSNPQYQLFLKANKLRTYAVNFTKGTDVKTIILQMSAGISVMAEYKGKSFTVYFTESRSYEEMEKVVRNGLRLLYYDRPIKLYEFMGRNT